MKIIGEVFNNLENVVPWFTEPVQTISTANWCGLAIWFRMPAKTDEGEGERERGGREGDEGQQRHRWWPLRPLHLHVLHKKERA